MNFAIVKDAEISAARKHQHLKIYIHDKEWKFCGEIDEHSDTRIVKTVIDV